MNSLAKACVATSARGYVEEHLDRWAEHPRIDIGIGIVIRCVGRGSAYAMMSGHLGARTTRLQDSKVGGVRMESCRLAVGSIKCIRFVANLI